MTTNRESYEAALGEFLLLYNRIENTLDAVLVALLERCGKKHLYNAGDMFARKLAYLELVALLFDPMHKPDFDRLRQINSSRNDLAHGHMHTDPNTGEVSIVKAQTSKSLKGKTVLPAHIKRLSETARQAASDLDAFLPYIWFAHTPPSQLPTDGSSCGAPL